MELNRNDFLNDINLVSAALANKDYIPLFTHFCFSEKHHCLAAYNDKIGLVLRSDLDLECAVPGVMLINILNSLSSETIEIFDKEDYLLIKTPVSNIKLPVMGAEDFPFISLEPPQGEDGVVIEQDFVDALEVAFTSLDQNSGRQILSCVTIVSTDDSMSISSSDGKTITRSVIPSTENFVDLVILPAEFCRQTINLWKRYEGATFRLYAERENEASIFVFDSEDNVVAMLGCRQGSREDLLDYDKAIARAFDGHEETQPIEFSDSLREAFQRAAVVTPTEIYGGTTLEIRSSKVNMHTQGIADVRDKITLRGEKHEDVTAKIDARMVVRALTYFQHIYVTPRCTIMKEGDNIHLISNKR